MEKREPDAIDFSPIFNFGKKKEYQQQREKELIRFQKIHDKKYNDDINKIIITIINFLQNNSFSTGLIELSLFDPFDVDGARFYSIVSAANDNIIDNYIQELIINLDVTGDSNTLIPNTNIYGEAYYTDYKPKLKPKPTSKYLFNPINIDNIITQFGGFYDLGSDIKIDVHEQVNMFFSRIKKACFFKKELNNKFIKKNLNASILVPMYRPVVKFKGQRKYIYNGGGIFVFGKFDKKVDINEFILKLRLILMKAILYISYSGDEIIKSRESKTNFELNIMHNFKTLFAVNIIEPLCKVKEYEQSKQNETLDNVRSFANKIVTQTYKLFETHKNNKKETINLEVLNQIILKVRYRLRLGKEELLFNVKNDKFVFLSSGELLTMIFEDIVKNAITAQLELAEDETTFAKYFKQKHIEIFLNIDTVNKYVSHTIITIFNSDTTMSITSIENAGTETVTNIPAGKTGMGLYLANYALMEMGAIEFENGRYLKIENDISGKGVNVSFGFVNRRL